MQRASSSNWLVQYFRSITLMFLFCCSIAVGSSQTARAADDLEQVALNLVTLLRSARAVISDNQGHINDAALGDKGLSGTAVVAKAKENFKKATGHDIADFLGDGLHGELLQVELDAIAAVMDDAQEVINEQGVGFKGFLPAIFARQVTEKFRAGTSKKADLKLTAPKNFVRNRANRPDKWEHAVIEDRFKSAGYPKGQPFGEKATKKGRPAYRLILPEYYKASCLSCHGDPKGERDITGGKKEGGKLGELGGAISVAIFD
ncbi:MAG: histidine kinase [Kordiimonadales bacterium]|nr:MAG: histidine kinase [Kordiimonadales bacterium]